MPPDREPNERGNADSETDVDSGSRAESESNAASESDIESTVGDDATAENGASAGSDTTAGDEVTAEPESTTVGPAEIPTSDDEPPGIEPLDEHLPPPDVDSRWWYWIAAVPLYFVASLLIGGFAFVIAVLGLATDLGGLFLLLFGAAFLLIALPGVILAVMFPLALYVDARAVAGANVDWSPDPILYGVLALAAVLVSAFTLSVPLSLYYLYQRHRHVGSP